METPKEILEEYGIVTVIEKFVKEDEAIEVICRYLNNLIDTVSRLKRDENIEKNSLLEVRETHENEETFLLIDEVKYLRQELESVKKRIEILFTLKNKYYEELKCLNKITEKLKFEAARTEDLVYAYAKRNNLTDFRDKWEQKSYTDADYTLYNLVGELIENINYDKKEK